MSGPNLARDPEVWVEINPQKRIRQKSISLLNKLSRNFRFPTFSDSFLKSMTISANFILSESLHLHLSCSAFAQSFARGMKRMRYEQSRRANIFVTRVNFIYADFRLFAQL
ncbi:hypothetical protein WA026_013282 [Henosepilachna vigintioctopunctata]|uniref:Uncharacterized protein n=1 Tax=Henosepilachna vigintioctopunctata TaxID=420089 RepID=A0AAW1UE67_9CUCU